MPLVHQVPCRVFWQNIKSPRWLSPPSAQIWHPVTSGFPKTKITLQGKRFQTIDEIQENTMGQLMVTGTLWGAYFEADWGIIVLYTMFLVLVSSSVNVSILHSVWLHTFRTGMNRSRQPQPPRIYLILLPWLCDQISIHSDAFCPLSQLPTMLYGGKHNYIKNI